MSKKADAFAQKLADLDTLVQSGYTERPEQGENLSLGCYENREETAEEAIKGWYVGMQSMEWRGNAKTPNNQCWALYKTSSSFLTQFEL